MVISKENSDINVDPKTWSPMFHIDTKFDLDIIGEQINFEKTGKQIKLGKIIS